MHFFPSLLDFIEEIWRQSRLLLRVTQVSNVVLIVHIEGLNLLQDLQWVVLNGLLEGYLENFFVYNLDDEVKVLQHFHVLLLDQLLLFVILLHELIVLPLSFVFQLFLLIVRVWHWSCWLWELVLLWRLFWLLLIEAIWPLVFKLCFIDIFDLHFDLSVLKVVKDVVQQLICNLVDFEVKVTAVLRPTLFKASTWAACKIAQISLNLFFHV